MPTDPKSALALAREAVDLAKIATPAPWYFSPWLEDHRQGSIATPNGGLIATFVNINGRLHPNQPIANQELCAHAGSHYATVARAAIEYAALLKRALPYVRRVEQDVLRSDNGPSSELVDLIARIDALTKGEQ